MEFKRDQFKATSVSELKKLRDKEDKIVGSTGGRDFIEIQEGINKIRLAPKFPNEKDFYLMRMVHWGSVESKDGDLKRLPILNSKIHGGTELDIFEEYISKAKEELKNDVEKAKLITDWKTGISSVTSWWAYGWKLAKGENPKFGIFEFKKSVRDQLNSITIIEDDEEAIEIDPFTDVEEGKPIIVTYDPKAKAADKYKTQLAKNALPLTDEMFEELTSKQPLSEMMRNVYTIQDFEKALEAIQNFDMENEIDIFDTEAFKSCIKAVKAQYSQDEKLVVKVEPKKVESSKKVVQVADEVEEEIILKAKSKIGDEFDSMDRTELKEYIGENELEVTVKKADSDDEIRLKVRNFISSQKEEDIIEVNEERKEDKTDKKKVVSIEELRRNLARK